MRPLPRPVTVEHEFFAGICRRLDGITDVLGEIRDRLGQANDTEAPPAADPPGPAPVDLREPAPPAAAESTSDPVELVEPVRSAKAAGRSPAKTTTRTKRGAGR